ncbi:MAG: hypothetical protein QRY72_02305 [Candidatus Rhabdochlamydia sp.]
MQTKRSLSDTFEDKKHLNFDSSYEILYSNQLEKLTPQDILAIHIVILESAVISSENHSFFAFLSSKNVLLKGDLQINKCKAFTAWPKSLKVEGSIKLSRCQQLTHLPEDLEIQENLDISNCPTFTSMLYPINLGGNLNLTGCSSLTSLPDWVVILGQRNDGCTRLVNLTGTGLSLTVLTRLQEHAQNIEGIQFHFSRQASKEYIIEFETLLPALQFWQEEAKSSFNLQMICQNLDQQLTQIQDHKNLLQFLIRLTGSADYSNLVTRAHLARRILNAAELMATDPETCIQFADLIH